MNLRQGLNSDAAGVERSERVGNTFPRLMMRLALAATVAAVAVCSAEASPESVALPGDALYPESVTSSAKGTLYVSSFVSGGIVSIKDGGKAEIFVKPGAQGSRSTFGVLADDPSNTLWVCSNDISAMGIAGPSEEKGSALKGFDLTSGEGKTSVKLPGERTLCNDIAIGPDGAAYVTDSFTPNILRLAPGATSFEVWKTDAQWALDGPGAGLDGIAFGQDGNLYVNTFTKAELFRVEVKDGKAGAATKLETSRPLVLADGMRPAGDGSFLMVEGNGKLDRVTVAGDEAKIETLREGFAGGLTGVTKVGDKAWVSEGQLSVVTDPSKKGSKPQLPFKLHAVPLKGQ